MLLYALRIACIICNLKGTHTMDRHKKTLPRYLAFKGDNGKYLAARVVQRYNYLEFSSSDIGDPNIVHTIVTNGDGTIRIKSNHFGKFWRRSPNWIWADSDDTTCQNRDTLFKVIKLGNNSIALQNLGNNYFCKRLTTEGKTSCLNAGVRSITTEAKLQLEEPVLSREIYDVDFDLSKSRVYGKKVRCMAIATAVNGCNSSNTARLTLSYTETETRAWNSSVTWKLGIKTTIDTGVPLIVDGKVEIQTEYSQSYSWGSSIQTTATQAIAYEVTVPPKTKVTVSVIATQGTCNVPFSYKQTDLLTSGVEETYHLKDGVYTGINCYDVKYETKEENIIDVRCAHQ